jgi:Flp pilus assembly protein TadD
MARLYRELGARLWAGEAVAESAPAPPAQTALAVSLAAFEQYVKGLVAEPPAARVPFLAKAIQLHPDFPAARIALAQSRAAAGEYRLALEALAPIGDAAPQAVEARLLAAVAHIALRDYTVAYQVLAALQARGPSALFLNDLGVVRIRASALPPGAGSATWYFSQARTLDPLDPDYLFNLGYAYWLEGNPQGASYWLREAVRLSPTDAAAHALLAQVLHAAGQTAEAARELALAQRLSSDFDGTDLKGGALPAPPRGLERLKEALEPPRAQRIDAALEMVGQREQRELSAFYLGRGRRAFEEERDREAESDLTRALYLSPYEAEAHLLLGRIYLRTGRLREAIDALKVSIWSEETAAAHVELAEAYLAARDPVSARTEAERALALEPKSVHARQLLDRLRQSAAAPV